MPYSISHWLIRCRNNCQKIILGLIAAAFCALPLSAQTPPEPETAPPDNTEESSAEPAPTTETPLYPSRDIRDKTLLANALEDESRWLDTAYGKILVLYRPTEAKVTKGALVLFHAAETPQSWPSVLENLRRNLPRYGWETLAVTLPQATPLQIPEREKNKNKDEQSDNEEDTSTDTETEELTASSSSTASSAPMPATREELITEDIKVAVDFLHANGQFNLVMLFDNSSVALGLPSLSAQIKENKKDPNTVDGPLQALILANLQPQEALSKAQLNAIFNQPQLPVMDLFFSPENEELKAQKELHRAVAMRNKLAHYQPLITELQPKSAENDYSSFIVGRIRGFMQAAASGSEIAAPSQNKN